MGKKWILFEDYAMIEGCSTSWKRWGYFVLPLKGTSRLLGCIGHLIYLLWIMLVFPIPDKHLPFTEDKLQPECYCPFESSLQGNRAHLIIGWSYRAEFNKGRLENCRRASFMIFLKMSRPSSYSMHPDWICSGPMAAWHIHSNAVRYQLFSIQ